MKSKNKIRHKSNASALPKQKKVARSLSPKKFDKVETLLKFFRTCTDEELRNLGNISAADVDEARSIWLQEASGGFKDSSDSAKKSKKKGIFRRFGFGFKKEDIVPCVNAGCNVLASDPEESKPEAVLGKSVKRLSGRGRRHSLDDLPRVSSVRTWSRLEDESSSPEPRQNRRSWPKHVLSVGVLENLGLLEPTVSSVSGSSSEVDPAENKKLSRRKVKGMLGIAPNDTLPQFFEVSSQTRHQDLHYDEEAKDPIDDLVKQAEAREMSTAQLQALAHKLLKDGTDPVTPIQIVQHRDLLENADEVEFCIFWSKRMESFLSQLITATETYSGNLSHIASHERDLFTKHRKPTAFYDAVDAVVVHVQQIQAEMGGSNLLHQLKVSREVEKMFNGFQKFATMMEEVEKTSQYKLKRCNRLTARVFRIIDPKTKEQHEKRKHFGTYTTIPYPEEHIKRVLREPQRQELKKLEKVYLSLIEYHNSQREKFYRNILPKLRVSMQIQAENMERRIKLNNLLSSKVLQSLVDKIGIKDFKVDKMLYKKRTLEEKDFLKTRTGTSRKGEIYHQGRLLKQPSVIYLTTGGFPLLTNRLVCDPANIHEQLDRLENEHFRFAYQIRNGRRMTSPGQLTPHGLIRINPSISHVKPKPIMRAKSRPGARSVTKDTTSDFPRRNPHLGDIMNDPELLALMSKFSKQTFCSENLEFLLAVDEFFIDAREDLKWEREQAMSIYRTFVEKGSPKWVNLKANNRKTIEFLAGVLFQGPDAKGIDLRTTFEDAYYEIAEIVENEILLRFIQSPMYKDYVECNEYSISTDDEKDKDHGMHTVAVLIGQAFPQHRKKSKSPKKRRKRGSL